MFQSKCNFFQFFQDPDLIKILVGISISSTYISTDQYNYYYDRLKVELTPLFNIPPMTNSWYTLGFRGVHLKVPSQQNTTFSLNNLLGKINEL